MWQYVGGDVISSGLWVSNAHSRHCVCLFVCCLSSGVKHSATVPAPCLSWFFCDNHWPVWASPDQLLPFIVAALIMSSRLSSRIVTETVHLPFLQQKLKTVSYGCFGLTFIYIITYRAVFSNFCPRRFCMSSTWLLKLTILICALF